MSKKLKDLLRLAATFLTLIGNVSAADFNINLNLALDNLRQEVEAVKTICQARSSNPATPVIGSSAIEINVPASGSLNQLVMHRFNAAPGKAPSDATGWVCFMRLRGPKNAVCNPWSPGDKTWCKPKEGAPFKHQLDGTFR
jgi:hypothetical protein